VNIGIMQGRLVPPEGNRFQSFPRNSWRLEFLNANKAGIDCIEWIYDEYGEDVNPINTDQGIEEIKKLSSENGVNVYSLCADYFMDKPFLRTTIHERNERIEKLIWLLHRCANLDINRIVLPFVDASQIKTDSELTDVIDLLQLVLPIAEEKCIEVHLETSLTPSLFKFLLDAVPNPFLKANYDSGNSSSLGYRPIEEFEAYGKRIGSIHIKDRIKNGGTVPLGTGDADFKSLFKQIKLIGYSGDFILQVARDIPGSEVDWIKKNRLFLIDSLKNVRLSL
jgi:hexulose-6-phosphate isomerase